MDTQFIDTQIGKLEVSIANLNDLLNEYNYYKTQLLQCNTLSGIRLFCRSLSKDYASGKASYITYVHFQKQTSKLLSL